MKQKFVVTGASKFSAAAIIAAIIPFASQEPRPQMNSPSSREPKKGGTVSMCVESVTTGSPQEAKILSRLSSAGTRAMGAVGGGAGGGQSGRRGVAHFFFGVGGRPRVARESVSLQKFNAQWGFSV